MLRAELMIDGPAASLAARSISPEAGRELPRTSTEVEMVDGIAVIRITASDTSAMRAAINSYLECVKVVEDIGKLTR
jgi:KEOPS complex subunit Pcc1